MIAGCSFLGDSFTYTGGYCTGVSFTGGFLGSDLEAEQPIINN